MIRTISSGPYSLIQGLFLEALKDGRIRIRVGERVYEGLPVA